MNFQPYVDMLGKWLITSGIPIIIIVILLTLAFKFANILIEKYFNNIIKSSKDTELEKRINTFKSAIKSIINILVFIVGMMMILDKLGIDIKPILAAAGVVGVAVGFGSQRLIEDIISGFIILIGDQIRVGDVVEIAGKSGLVEKVDLKMTTLRDIEGNVHYIRNGKIDIVTNKTKDYSCYVFDIGFSCRENIDEVIDVIKHTAEELRNANEYQDDILEPIEIFGLDKFSDSIVVVKARIKTKPLKQWVIGREFNKRLKKRFDELNIDNSYCSLNTVNNSV